MGERKIPRAGKSFAKGPDAQENQCLRQNLSSGLPQGFKTWKPFTCPPLAHWLDVLKHHGKLSQVDKVDNGEVCFYFKEKKLGQGSKEWDLLFYAVHSLSSKITPHKKDRSLQR